MLNSVPSRAEHRFSLFLELHVAPAHAASFPYEILQAVTNAADFLGKEERIRKQTPLSICFKSLDLIFTVFHFLRDLRPFKEILGNYTQFYG